MYTNIEFIRFYIEGQGGTIKSATAVVSPNLMTFSTGILTLNSYGLYIEGHGGTITTVVYLNIRAIFILIFNPHGLYVQAQDGTILTVVYLNIRT